MNEKVLIVNREAEKFAQVLSAECPLFEFQTANSAEGAMEFAASAEILIGLAPDLKDDLLGAMPNLKWIHALTTGLDNLLASQAIGKDVVISNSSGFHGPQMSELAVLLMLSTLRNFPKILDNQKAKNWERWPQPLLQNKTACIVGLGAIAEAMAPLLNAFGMVLTGVSDGRQSVPGFSKIYKRSQLQSAAAQADFIIVLVPYSASTHHIVDETVLSAMPQRGILINLSRGGCVDEVALQKHLQAGKIQAAALDVFAREPLPEDSDIWETPGLTITPHLGGFSDTYREQVLPIVVENLNAWTKGGSDNLSNLISRESPNEKAQKA